MAINSHNDERWNRQLEVMWKLQKNKNDNEIKEILDNLIRYRNEDNKYQPEDILIIEDVWLLLDYITNLQEENTELKELADKYEEEHNNEFQCWKRDRKELLDKRARIDKAIEYINLTGYGTDFSMNAEEVDVLFNILKGE